MDDFERRLCAQTQQLLIKTSQMFQMNPEHFSTILYSQFNNHASPVTPFCQTESL